MKTTKRILALVLALVMVFALTGCSDEIKMVGRWNITKVTAGDFVMDQDELNDLGLSSAGYLKLNKSGSCVVNLLGDEYEGTWELNDNGEAVVTYGKDLKGTATRDDKVITFIDSAGNEYEMEK
ncbi:MAG: hypothetical protein KBS68_05705 [Clostridiales bacterium]|nr:hypothetical protein [Candidatus Crickella merdequi]